MADPRKEARFEPKLMGGKWCVWDNETGAPAIVKGVWQVDLDLDDADDLADALSFLDQEEPGALTR